jgi:non-ribosomal peptide synthase protein (TIGR01720 family)
LAELSDSDETRQEAEFWLDERRNEVAPLPVDRVNGTNTYALAKCVSVSLESDETTALLEQVPAAYRTEINDVLLAALAEALADWTGQTRWLVDLEGHGRLPLFDDVDLSRTVGWFTHCFPVLLELADSRTSGDVLRRVKGDLRNTPRAGLSYGLLRYLNGDGIAARLRSMPAAELSFNYLGRFDGLLPADGLFALSAESCGKTQSPRSARRHLLGINAFVRDHRLHLEWTYSEAVYCRETIERLAESHLHYLRELIEHCTSDAAGGATPADFPLAEIDEGEIEQIARLLDRLE